MGWTKWKHNLQFIENIEIPRWYGFTKAEFQEVQLHIQADALGSSILFTFVIYTRILYVAVLLLESSDLLQLKRNQ